MSLHGDLEQRDRDQTLVRFANGSARVLVATDVAARGLDIKSLELVVNFELAWDPEVHVHRIGRTARAGNSGLAISFCAPEEAQRANIISDMLQIKLNWQTLPANSSIVPLEAEMATLCIDGGKKAKMRPGDVLGALTGDIGLDGADIGKIAVHPAQKQPTRANRAPVARMTSRPHRRGRAPLRRRKGNAMFRIPAGRHGRPA